MKKIYAIGRLGKEETKTTFYKYFEYKEDAEKELNEIAKTYYEEDIKSKTHQDLHTLNEYWYIKEFSLY